MAYREGTAPSRVFYGWWVAAAFSLIIFLIHQMGAALGAWLGGFLFGHSGGYGLAFGVSCTLLLVGAGLSLTIHVAARPAVRRELQPVAGGR